MPRSLPVSIDLEMLEVQLGASSYALARTSDECTFVVTDTREEVRLLTFDERTVLVSEAWNQPDPAKTLLSSLGVESQAAQGVALALAGGAELAAPYLEIRNIGCDGRVPALFIDREFPISGRDSDTGWTELVFELPLDVPELIATMVDNLLSRGTTTYARQDREQHRESRNWPGRLTAVSPVGPDADLPRQNQATATAAELRPAQPEPAPNQNTEMLLPVLSYPEPLATASLPAKPELKPASWTRPKLPSFDLSQDMTAPAVDPNLPPPMQARAAFRFELPKRALPQQTPQQTQPVQVGPPSWPPAPLAPSTSLDDWPMLVNVQPAPIRREDGAVLAQVLTSELAAVQPAADWLDELARLLEMECDLRGIEE